MKVLWMQYMMGDYDQGGMEWVDELCDLLTQNVDHAYKVLTEKVKGVKLAKPEVTYLLYLDCTEWL